MAKRKAPPEDDAAKQRLETAAGILGAILALGTIGIIVWDGIAGEGGPPIVVVEAESVHAGENGFVLELSVFNRGQATAAQVAVEGTLSRDGEVVETSEATFDYVPSGSRRRGGLFFAADPRDHDVAVRAKGYVDP